MRFHTRLVAACAISALLAACGGQGNSTPVLPSDPTAQTQIDPSAQTQADSSQISPDQSQVQTESSIRADAVTAAGALTPGVATLQGTVTAARSGGLTVRASTSQLVTVAYTRATKVYTTRGSTAIGHYVFVAGTGSLTSGITARYVAAYTVRPGTVTLSGTLLGTLPYGIDIRSGAHGTVPILAGTATKVSGSLVTGATVSVSGYGTANGVILASTMTSNGTPVSTATSPPATPDVTTGGTTMRHVLTSAYYGTPYGTTSVPVATAARYLSWANTGIANTNAYAAAGMKTMMYTDSNKTETKDPLYRLSSESAFAHTCSGARIHDFFDKVTQYLMDPGSAALRTAYAGYIAKTIAGHHLTAVYQDDSVPPSIYQPGFLTPGKPCSYSDAKWVAGQSGLQSAIALPTIFNSLRVSQTWPLLNNPKVLGGNYESCFSSTTKIRQQVTYVWVNIQNAGLYTTARHKVFQCMALDSAPASTALASRMYTIASFLMTYNPTYSLLWEFYTTPSNFRVMPESQLVALSPVVAQPSAIASLRTSGGAYAREYNTCYYAGKAIGACAMVVNNEGKAHAAPRFRHAFHHTVVLHGNGIVDGGTVTFNGAAPPASVAPISAYIAVP